MWTQYKRDQALTSWSFSLFFCVILLLKHTRKIKFTTLAIFQCRGGIKYIHNIVQCHVVIFINFLEVQLIYNVVLISAVHQNDLVTYMYTFFFIFFSIVVYCRIVNGVPEHRLILSSICNSLHLLTPDS